MIGSVNSEDTFQQPPYRGVAEKASIIYNCLAFDVIKMLIKMIEMEENCVLLGKRSPSGCTQLNGFDGSLMFASHLHH